jgi:hypothetical protein
MLGWARCRFHKKRAGTEYNELMFLHPVLSVGYVVHSGAFLARTSAYYFSGSSGTGAVCIKSALGHVMPNLCFYISWDLRGHIVRSDASGV